MKRTIATVSAAALAMSLATVEPVEAHPALLIVPVVMHTGITAGWAAVIGVGGLLAGGLLANAAWNNHWWNYGYATPAYGAPVAYTPAGYAAPAPVGHCHLSHRWINGFRTLVRVCVVPVY